MRGIGEGLQNLYTALGNKIEVQHRFDGPCLVVEDLILPPECYGLSLHNLLLEIVALADDNFHDTISG